MDGALIAEAASILGRPLDPAVLPALAQYVDMVATWNRRVNLTGAREARALVDVLLADALELADEELLPPDARFVDVGAGAGAPSIPLLLLRSDLRATLVEPQRKRAAFLRSAMGALDLALRIELIEAKLGETPLSPFDVALSRATFEPAEWLVRGLALARRVIVLTGAEPFASTERSAAERGIANNRGVCGGFPPRRIEAPEGCALLATRAYRLPFAGTPRAISLFSAGARDPGSAMRAKE